MFQLNCDVFRFRILGFRIECLGFKIECLESGFEFHVVKIINEKID